MLNGSKKRETQLKMFSSLQNILVETLVIKAHANFF